MDKEDRNKEYYHEYMQELKKSLERSEYYRVKEDRYHKASLENAQKYLLEVK